MALLTVTFTPTDRDRTLVSEVIGGMADVRYVADLDDAARQESLRHADVILARNTGKELQPAELPLVGRARLIQFMSAGVDHIPIGQLPRGVPIAKNAGAYADQMAEHTLAMTLAAAKRLLVEHRNLSRGEFNQFAPNRFLRGGICGIFGFGGIGIAAARLMRCIGMRIHAINRRGVTDEPVEWIGTPDRLDELMAAADVLIVSAPLTRVTQSAVGRHQLSLMKDDAILVNVARGEIVDEDALYERLTSKPQFTACIDAWWTEPVRHGEFRMKRPFLELPNVIGSPHNSGSVVNGSAIALRYALNNCRRALIGERPLHLLSPDEIMR